MRRAARVDGIQADTTDALRAMGASVQPLHTVGDGCPDLLVGYRSHTILIELKDASQPPSKRRLTTDQIKWHGEWRGGILAVVSDVEGAVRLLRSLELQES